MQVSSPHLVPPSFLFGIQSDEVFTSKLEQDFKVKAKLTEEVSLATCEENGEDSCLPEVDNHGSDSDDDDFSFVCTNPDGSPISADDIFHNGQIRPVFPLFNRDLLFSDDGESAFEAKSETSAASLRPPLRKLFFEERDQDSPSSSSETDEPEGPFCSWKGKAMEASPEVCKKSNSTGFSKLWRFREFVARSNSDGKDAFVFLNPSHKNPSTTSKTTATSPETTSTYPRAEKSAKGIEKRKVVGKRGKSGGQTASSAHERHYVRNRAMKEADKRKSYLPYRQDLFGFFTNVNGLTRDVHPF